MFWQLPLLLGAAGSALGRGITVIPGGTIDTVTPLTLLSPLSQRSEIAPRQAAPVPLRIMSLGASVTFGTGSSTGNSYRKDLRDLLVADGSTVTYVGEFSHGNFTDSQVEAQGGFTISQIAELANKETPLGMPNLILLDAGTNNCNKGGLVLDAGANVMALINKLFAQSPGSTVILATLLVNDQTPAQDACRVDINAQYSTLAAQMTAQGAKLVMVDMRSPYGPTTADLADKRHPNDVGYQKMAKVWAQGIQKAVSLGLITAPVNNSSPAAGGA